MTHKIFNQVLIVILFLSSTILLNSCAIDSDGSDIRLNQIQVIGTHNSYKLDLSDEVVAILETNSPGASESIRYGHQSLTHQLENAGVRKFELDVFADTVGGLYANPKLAEFTGDLSFSNLNEMMQPGFKVLHVQDIDYRSTCLTFRACLSEIKIWSSLNPNHIPVFIMIEAKDGKPQDNSIFSFTEPIHINTELLYKLENEILEVFDRGQILVPDDVRGEFTTLEESILKQGWPTLDSVRGKVFFALDNTGIHRDYYLSESETLANRILFVSSEPGHPSAAFIKMNDALSDEMLIRERVSMGYLVRTRSDIPMYEAATGDTTRRNAAFRSGAQFISTDFPEPALDNGFYVTFNENGVSIRCNPVSQDIECTINKLIE